MKVIEEKEDESGGEESPPKGNEEEKKEKKELKEPTAVSKIKKAVTPLFSMNPDEDTDTQDDGELKVAEVKNSELV